MNLQPSQSAEISAHKLNMLVSDPMLAACRDLAIQLLSQSLEGFFVKLEQTYLELADKTHDRNLREVAMNR